LCQGAAVFVRFVLHILFDFKFHSGAHPLQNCGKAKLERGRLNRSYGTRRMATCFLYSFLIVMYLQKRVHTNFAM
jgi:hypothetical protein